MSFPRSHFAALGRARSAAKTAAVRLNGACPPRPGSRPRGRPARVRPAAFVPLLASLPPL